VQCGLMVLANQDLAIRMKNLGAREQRTSYDSSDLSTAMKQHENLASHCYLLAKKCGENV